MLSHRLQRNFAVKVKSFKNIWFGAHARSLLKEGTSMVYKSAQVSLGPGGRNALLDYEAGLPKITKDGVTIIKNVFMRRREAELGANLIRKVAHSTNVLCGDGTTTSAMLSCSIFDKGEKLVAAGINPIVLKKGMEKARDAILEFLDEITVPIKSYQEILSVSKVTQIFPKISQKNRSAPIMTFISLSLLHYAIQIFQWTE
jgi:chaperonin GroEL